MNNLKINSAVVIVLVFLDQLMKFFIELYSPNIDLILFSITKVYNTGASFGILKGGNTALIWVSIMALGFIMMNIKNITEKQTLPLLIIVAGILGNLIDRVFRGHVVDFFDLGWWPVFNLADSCIVVGVIVLAYVIFEESDESIPRKTQGGKVKNSRIR